jgi:riboflavin synthase
MFTGLIDDVGTIETVHPSAAGRTFRVRCQYTDLVPGESVSLNGACLTVRECGPNWFTVAAIVTTIARTAMGQWSTGATVNLERALRMGDRLGGHLVQGHVDGVGQVRAVRRQADARVIDVAIPSDLIDGMVPHGSIAIDGVSLTVNDLPGPDLVQVALIDYTIRHTTLGTLSVGDAVHVEADVIGKYVRRLAAPYLISDTVTHAIRND